MGVLKKSLHLTAPARVVGRNITTSDLDSRLIVDSVRAHALLDLSRHSQESLLDIRGVLGGSFEERNTEAVGEFLYRKKKKKGVNVRLMGLIV